MKTLNITDYDFEDYSISNAEFTKAWFQIDGNNIFHFENHEWTLRDIDGVFIRPLIKSEIKLIEEYSEEMFLNNYEDEIEIERQYDYADYLADCAQDR